MKSDLLSALDNINKVSENWDNKDSRDDKSFITIDQALKEEGYYEQSAKESCLGEACDCCERIYKG